MSYDGYVGYGQYSDIGGSSIAASGSTAASSSWWSTPIAPSITGTSGPMASATSPAMMALAFAKGVVSYEDQMAQAKAQQAEQAYRNTMTRLSGANSQNAITTNEELSSRQFALQAISLQRNFLESSAATSVEAAATGATGRSVNEAMYQTQQNYNAAEGARQQQLQDSYLAFDQQRQNTAFDVAANIDYSYIPKPSFLGTIIQSL